MLKFISKVALVSIAAARDVWIDPNDRVLRDKDQRHVVFHGVNVVYKVAPYIPESDVFDA